MAELIATIYGFFTDFYIKAYNFVSGTQQGVALQMKEQIFTGDLISCNFTVQNLILIYIPTIVTLILIFLVFKVLWKLLFGKVWR